ARTASNTLHAERRTPELFLNPQSLSRIFTQQIVALGGRRKRLETVLDPRARLVSEITPKFELLLESPAFLLRQALIRTVNALFIRYASILGLSIDHNGAVSSAALVVQHGDSGVADRIDQQPHSRLDLHIV